MTSQAGLTKRVDLIHLADVQVGALCRFPIESAAADLRRALKADFQRLELSGELDPATPRLLVVAGDIANQAKQTEYTTARQVLVGIAEDLGVPLSRIVVVPGNHDVSWLKCRHYFETCAENDEPPAEPYHPKLAHWQRFFGSLYHQLPELERPRFSDEQPWTNYSFPELGLQVLGLNSCWKERHDEDEQNKAEHFGWVDQVSLAAQLDAAAVNAQPLTIAVVHHNPMPDQSDAVSLREGRRVLGSLADHGARLLLCGHSHMADAGALLWPYEQRQILVVPGGSIAVVAKERPEDIRNQYQVVQLGPNPRVLRRCYNSQLDGGRFDADCVDGEWRCPLPAWVIGITEAPKPTVSALIQAYREHCLGSYQDLVGSLYRRDNRVSNPLIRDVFVPLKVQAPEPDRDPREEQRHERQEAIEIGEYLEQTGQAPLLLAGGAGSGKTTFLRYLVCRWADKPGEGGEPDLCLYLPLGRIAEQLAETKVGVLQLWSVIAAFLAGIDVPITVEQLDELAAAGRVRLLLDGLDELRGELRPGLVEALRSAIQRAGSGLRVILSSRPYALPDTTALPGFHSRQILNLDPDQQELFLQRYHQRLFEAIPDRAAQVSEQLLSALPAHRALAKLGQTPLMLLGVAVVHYREGRLPHGRDEVFKALTEAVLELRFPAAEQRRQWTRRLQELALALHQREERDLALPVLHGLVGDVLAAENGSQPARGEIDSCCDQLLGVCGLLEASDRSARFRHLGFQEYLAATALATELRGDYAAGGVKDKYLDNEWWREAMAMLVSQLCRGVSWWEGIKLWRAVFGRRHEGASPVARLAQLAESLQEIEPERRRELAAESRQLQQEIVAIIEHAEQPGELADRVAAAEALGRLGDPRCSGPLPRMVDIGNNLAVSAYPITVAQYQHFIKAGGYDPEGFGKQWLDKVPDGLGRHEPQWWPSQLWTPNHPVVGVTCFEAAAYCTWLSSTQAGEGEQYRLPFEQEWQHAAQGAAENSPYPWGTQQPGTGARARANYRETGLRERRPTPVGLFPSGAADWRAAGKLADMAGNVWEWCHDELDDDGKPQRGGLVRPLRGGACWRGATDLEVAGRRWHHAARRSDDLGFRVVRCPARPRPPVDC